MVDSIISDTKKRMEKSIESLTDKLNGIRTGRASQSLIEKIMVPYYGTPTPINQLASIGVPDARTIQVQPWDKTVLDEVEKAIAKSDLGLNPMNDGTLIRLNFPPLTEERRRELTKVVKRMGEDAKVAIRAIRRDINDSIKKREKSGELPEDEAKHAQQDVQQTTDGFIKHIDELTAGKESEIMEV